MVFSIAAGREKSMVFVSIDSGKQGIITEWNY